MKDNDDIIIDEQVIADKFNNIYAFIYMHKNILYYFHYKSIYLYKFSE